MTTLIVIPTYNEQANLPLLIPDVRKHLPLADLLIVDDNSPDGTGRLADEMSRQDDRIHCLHRQEKDGLGRAYIAGFSWGLERRYDRLLQMDADLSHDPKYLPTLFAACDSVDLALGSRYVPGGGTKNWGVTRKMLSRGGSLYARTILGLNVRDLTGGFKCWRRSVLENINLGSVRSNGYSFQIEMTYRALLRGYSLAEIPIIFADRTGGESKMSKKIIFEAMTMVWRLRLQARQIGSGASPAERI